MTNLKAGSGPTGEPVPHRGASSGTTFTSHFQDLHGGPLTGCSVGPEPSLKRLHSAERSVFFFLWTVNWLSGKVSR